jgi:hypothetical protein
MLSKVLIGGMIWMLCAAAPAQSDAMLAGSTDDPVSPYVSALAEQAGGRVSKAIGEIQGEPRRLLAMRSYLRAEQRVQSRWSWSSAEIERFEKSLEIRDMLAEVNKVTAAFEQQNPGFSLYANTRVRSLGVQIERWNNNRTIGRLADTLHAAAVRHLTQQSNLGATDAASLKSFAAFLKQWQPAVALPLAAPGLSLHGQARAIDFQIRSQDRIIASTETASVAKVWDGQRWSEKLRRAVNAASNRFSGPLAIPHEPWHYEYIP